MKLQELRDFCFLFPEGKEQESLTWVPSALVSAASAWHSPDSHLLGQSPPRLPTPASVSCPPRQDKHTFPFVFSSTPSFFLCMVKGWLLICNSKESNDSLDCSTFQGKVFHAFRRHASLCYEITSICGTYSPHCHVLCKTRGLGFLPCTGTKLKKGICAETTYLHCMKNAKCHIPV